ncbi:unnamed protein product [Didymodactylos carnosus]|uniref:Transient receptor potential cation channel subfamily A member 1 n=3 Tax=Didymodactylos carnosus TaxID=1234261 RepID=A0A814FD78_9BILA|nr:unnamed protein product [Didymodactylos carnosus]CAF3753810.1 unnamed protein product [Didymodactylos carnosus]
MNASSRYSRPPNECSSNNTNQMGVIEYLYTKGAKLHQRDEEGRTSLHHAVLRRSCLENAKQLITLIKDHERRNDVMASGKKKKILNEQEESLINARDAQNGTSLHFVCRFVDTDAQNNVSENIVQLLIDSGAQVDAVDKNYCTPLHYCLQQQLNNSINMKSATVQEYIEMQDKNNNTALCLAAEHGCEETVKILLKNKAQRNARGKEFYQPIHLAAKSGNVRVLEILLDDASMNVQKLSVKSNKETPLHVACQYNRTGAVQHLIQSLTQNKTRISDHIEHADNKDYTPLLTAAYYDHFDCVKTLVKNGAIMTDVKDDGERNILQICAKRLSINVLKEILVQLPERKLHEMVKNCDKFGNNPLHSTGRANNSHIHSPDIDKKEVEICQLLLNTFMSKQQSSTIESERDTASAFVKHSTEMITKRNNDYRTLLYEACLRGKVAFIQYLVEKIITKERHSLLEVVDDELKTALHIAADVGQVEIVKLLIEYGANIEARDMNDSTPLYEACSRNQYRCAKLLIKNHVPLDDIDEKGCTPLHLAKFISHTSWMKSMKNAQLKTFVTDREIETDTPLRKSIRLMPVKAEEVLKRCITRLGNEETTDYTVRYNYELLEDQFAGWVSGNEKKKGSSVEKRPSKSWRLWINNCLMRRPNSISVEQSADQQSTTSLWSSDEHKRNVLQHNHPLYIMAISECEDLIKSELVDRLIQRKWSQFTRLVFIITLTFYLWFLACFTTTILNVKHSQYYYFLLNYNVTDTTCETIANLLQNSQQNPSADGLKQPSDYVLKYMLLGLIAFHLFKYLYLIVQHWQYVLFKISLLELTSLALCLYYSQDWYSWQMSVKLRCPEQWSVGFAVGEIEPMMSRAKFKRSQLRIILISEYEVIMPLKLLQYFAKKNKNEVVLPHKTKWYNKPFDAMKRFFEGNKKKEFCDEQTTNDSNREQLDNIALDQEKTKEDIQKIQNGIKDIQVYMKQMNEQICSKFDKLINAKMS